MSDLRDVVNARHEAADARSNAQAYGSSIEEHGYGDTGMAVLLAAEAVCAELRALATLIDHARGDAQV